MFDIAKCEDDECPRANNCWRFTSPPNQIEWIITPERDEDGCDMFWPATYHPDPENGKYPPVTDDELTKE